MQFNRTAENDLNIWKSKKNRKPLIVRGARQVGKTTLIKNFAQSYRQFIYLNLEKKDHLAIFEKYDEISDVVDSISLTFDLTAEYSETLIFIDEIQESPKAIRQLRYFYEEFPDLHVIAAGSLLEFSLGEVRNFPVGRVEYLYLSPLNFEEYLMALEHKTALKALNEVPFKKTSQDVLLKLFNKYAIIGGMPEIVKTYVEEQNVRYLQSVYESIWATYQDDVVKYAKNENERKVIRHIMRSAPNYLDERVKFQNFGNSNFKSREVSEAMKNLDAAKVIQLIYPTTDIELPIKTDYKKSPRLQFLDTGIVGYALSIQADLLGVDDLSDSFKGALIPHLITQEVLSLNSASYKKPHFWVREKAQASAEVDLVLPFQNKIIPIEIKSGSKGKLKSLHQFMEKADHPYAIRMYGGQFSIEEHQTPSGKKYMLMNLPYFLGTKLQAYINYFVDSHAL